MLSADERDRADRFWSENLRRAFAISRGGLRFLLAGYLGRHSREIALSYGRRGKPELQPGSRLRFNLSHSGLVTLYAFTLDCEIGLDVEQLRELPDHEAIATRFFSAGEVTDLRSLDLPEKLPGFFRCWTRKEAYIKAVGDGLAIPLDKFQVTLLPGVPASLVKTAGASGSLEAWTLHHLEPAPGYVGALAYPDRLRDVTIHPLLKPEELIDAFREHYERCRLPQ
ncbi:MAG TPA: 4'-phosphopantetheinyl transferase superfamily protein [Chthoniobacterales bacterium]|nr:4'-phosphopantetheinyl transferase superfamily protein [Chthoniobacterales bacterium]